MIVSLEKKHKVIIYATLLLTELMRYGAIAFFGHRLCLAYMSDKWFEACFLMAIIMLIGKYENEEMAFVKKALKDGYYEDLQTRKENNPERHDNTP